MGGELKGCPFCGDVPVRSAQGGYRVRCDSCGACGPEAEFKSKRGAAWNRRAPDQSAELVSELVRALEEVSRVYDGMEDGDGEMCPTLIKVRATLAKAKAGGA